MKPLALAIESSCDDTSVALIRADGFVVHMVSENQDRAHQPFGGVVPEIAGRRHSEAMLPLINRCLTEAKIKLEQVEAYIVTNRPGLIGSLIVGVVTAKSLALANQKKIIGVNHLEGHILAPFLSDEKYQPEIPFEGEFLALAVSGGHTTLYHVKGLGDYTVLGATIDDAAGEAFDKFGKMMGLGFPAGPLVDREASQGNKTKFQFPRGLAGQDTLNMSFSGLKASAQRLLLGMTPLEIKEASKDLCASFQEAIVDVLLQRLEQGQKKTGLKQIILTGGVSANSSLRSRALEWSQKNKLKLVIPPLRYCTDNAAMIGYAGWLRLQRGEFSELDLAPSPANNENDFQGLTNEL